MYAQQALPTIRFEDMGGRAYELPAQTDCWPAPADLRADAPAPIIVTADEKAPHLIYATSDGGYRPLLSKREWLAEQVKDALVLALVPDSTTGALAGYVRGVAGSDRPLPLLPAQVQERRLRLQQVIGCGWMIRPLTKEARVCRRTEVCGPNGGIDVLEGRYGWGKDETPPTRSGVFMMQLGDQSLIVTPDAQPPVVPERWQVLAHRPLRPTFELDAPDRKVIAVAPDGPVEQSKYEVVQQRWLWCLVK